MKPNWIGRLQNIVHKGPTPVVTAKAMQWHAVASQSESQRAAGIWLLLCCCCCCTLWVVSQ